MLLTADAVVTGREVMRPGWIEIGAGVVLGVGVGVRNDAHDLGAVTVVPGFVDTHVHGGGGGSFAAGTRDETLAAMQFHLLHGTTTMVASLVTATSDELLREVEQLSDDVRAGVIAGVHLEGPWLAVSRRGAHDGTLLRDPDPDEIDRILALGGDAIRMVTVAPERAGGIDAIRCFVEAGVIAAVGHTEATYAQTRAAIDAGATVGTHLFNAMRPIHHREPGPVIALLEDPRVTVEVIADGVHVDPALYRHVANSAGPDRVSLVTDAMSAAGMADGPYRLGPLDVQVVDGVAHVAGTDTIAGSTATMDKLFRFAVRHCGLPSDEALLRAVQQTSINPARALGLPADGLTSGSAADLVVLDAELAVTGVLRRGEWVVGP
ncbi:N-acetylglucosamine-6-phosphate deacetylase [Aldersonia kunmingensis]|uniref:N-acetylglucosamine-6-phosphate deacetylase n=1 Tax=Aldersonia kunmingensis TaxID=408066 RepID=UPI0008372FB5|nr:N-acetylglucosamine-6-phosphate deacetylase [Aldersonia kunmingensis]